MLVPEHDAMNSTDGRRETYSSDALTGEQNGAFLQYTTLNENSGEISTRRDIENISIDPCLPSQAHPFF